jgi:hypothetical protein
MREHSHARSEGLDETALPSKLAWTDKKDG